MKKYLLKLIDQQILSHKASKDYWWACLHGGINKLHSKKQMADLDKKIALAQKYRKKVEETL